MNIERLIFSHLLNNEDYSRKALPFLQAEYFHDSSERIVFELIHDYVTRYNSLPTHEALYVDLSNHNNLNEDQFKECQQILRDIPKTRDLTSDEYLLVQTEDFCQTKAIHNALRESIQIMDSSTDLSRGTIPQLLTDALAVSFDNHIGHDFIDDADERYAFYHQKEEKVGFDIERLNKITNGGLPRKSLTLIMAGVHVGKSLFMCHCAANNLAQGKNVLYISMEMAEEKIAERIDANLMRTPINELKMLEKEVYDRKMKKIKSYTKGKLIIKEYPTAGASAANFRHLLNELKLKKNFVPDIIYIDYLNICASSRVKMGASINSYTYVKSIAEEVRGLAIEFNVPIVSATQVTRGAMSSSDIEMSDVSESIGVAAAADAMFAIVSSDELKEMNQIMVKQIKNRFGDVNYMTRFVVGIDRPRMRLFDVEEASQTLMKDVGDTEPTINTKKFDKKKFEGFS